LDKICLHTNKEMMVKLEDLIHVQCFFNAMFFAFSLYIEWLSN